MAFVVVMVAVVVVAMSVMAAKDLCGRGCGVYGECNDWAIGKLGWVSMQL